MFNRRTAARPGASAPAVALVMAALALAGCESGGDRETDGKKDSPAVIAPGKPGEPAKTLSAEEAEQAGDDDSPNSADFGYVRMMIVHHRQALVMTDLAPDRAESGRVKKLAERISAGQGPEITAMEGWLANHGGDGKGGHGGHEDHGSMPGMATEKQLAELRAARGEKFDELFLKLMITHHTGAVTMATDVLKSGNNVLVEEMAGDVISQQSIEIRRMRELD
ncbi:DUF305 domain-containing protein [Streptomyces sp. NPDC018031]|uniref:DUF305 domain-containing protein n=1 Tax=Streptomyces sp. NPDC018031 TaxID=3365033 RepID=UPI0037946A8B